jgi:hypothetical protein
MSLPMKSLLHGDLAATKNHEYIKNGIESIVQRLALLAPWSWRISDARQARYRTRFYVWYGQ